MKLFRFDRSAKKSIDAYGSSGFVISRIAQLIGEAVLNCAYLEENGVIGYHQAAAPQLFLVVEGKGWVRNETSERISVEAGQAVFWDKNEWHESGTETGLTAIIIEGNKFDLSKLMPAV